MNDVGSLREQLEICLLNNDKAGAERLLIEGLRDMSPLDRIELIITPTLERIGSRWEVGEVAMSQIYQGSRICDSLVEKILATSGDQRKKGVIIAAACLEDHHLLGIKIVSLMVRAAGYDVIDYGSIAAEDLAERACRDRIQYLLISTLMLRSALRVRKVREELEQMGCNVRLIVGGAPFRFDKTLCKNVLADFTSDTPMGAIKFIDQREGER